MAQNDRPALPSLRDSRTIDMARNASGGFDAEAYWVMDRRDNQLIEDEILQGAGSKTFVYSFKISNKQVSGVSVIGAQHLAAHYGGLKHRIIATIEKTGALHIYTSYPTAERDMKAAPAVHHELAEEPDYFKVLVEMTDLKTGNTRQIETVERRLEYRDDGTSWEKPHYQRIAQSKAYRNAVLALIPQDVKIRWLQQQLKLTEIITDDVIGEKRKAVLSYTAKASIPLAREAVNQLTMEQISALSDVAKERDRDRFLSALDGLGLMKEGVHGEDDEDKGQEKERGKKTRPAAKGQPSTEKETTEGSAKAGTPPADEGLKTETEQVGQKGERRSGPAQTGKPHRPSLFSKDD